MQLEDYFDFFAPDDIRLKGTRIGIESVLFEYLHRAQSPESIAEKLPTVTLEQAYATILYYLHNQTAVSRYLSDYLAYCQHAREQQAREQPPAVARLRQIKENAAAAQPTAA
jgi:uncharacterized protein (DUF433 family)